MNGSYGACEPVQIEDGYPFSGRSPVVQNISLQLGTNANEMV